MEGMELVSFQIISSVGTAKSMFIEAIYLAKQGKIQEAKQLIKEGDTIFIEGHKAHAKLIQKEATGETIIPQLLLVHAEDQLMSAEGFKTIATEIIDLYQKLFEKNLIDKEND
ncbi:PTS lactose/cellobiose transporter subunit IIA [Faecalicoccus pleomorphus]|uniref:PTS lactose/cellobiose transporter subunit IIA n=1 Tax=Faecalicoccus pleomorphus TaxID=1323 RepID=A0A7X9NG26_9FIRM|nr:PTS lactose/cellobiose transporter subunit IIA [Faecalicoccus pleomorphus]NME43604.1 PTS lactose/cellobiose transporter subunit IIA [Faecalicoccus pleomorphus]